MQEKSLKYAGLASILGAFLIFELAFDEDIINKTKVEINYFKSITEDIINEQKEKIDFCKSIKDDIIFDKQIMTEEELEKVLSKIHKCTFILPFIC